MQEGSPAEGERKIEVARRPQTKKEGETNINSSGHPKTYLHRMWPWLSIANRPNQPHTRAQGQEQQQKQQQVVVIIGPDGLP